MKRPSSPNQENSEPLWEHQARIHPAELLVGHFVARMDRDWSDSPFLIQGVMIETPEQKEWFERHCAWVVVDLKPVKSFKKTVTLEDVKHHPKVRDIPLVKQSRLSVTPLARKEFETLLEMGKTTYAIK